MGKGALMYDVYCCYSGQTFTALVGVLARSIRANCPDANLLLEELPVTPPVALIRSNWSNNAAKIAARCRFVQQAQRPWLLLDADTLVLRDLAPIWERSFDIAYCLREHRCPIIGGVIFGRPTTAARTFLLRWAARALALVLNPHACDEEALKWGGLSQACLVDLVQTTDDAVLLGLPAAEWNSCDQTWDTFGPETRIVHLKGRLRREVLTGRADERGPNGDLAPIVRAYCKYLTGA